MLLSVHLKNKSSHNWSTSRPWCYFKMSRSLHGAGETPNQSEASLCCMLFRKWLNLYLCPLAPTHTQTKSMWKSNTQLLLDHSRQPATLFYREFIQFGLMKMSLPLKGVWSFSDSDYGCTGQLPAVYCAAVQVSCSWRLFLSPTDLVKARVNEGIRPVKLYTFILQTAVSFQVTQLPQLDEFACFARLVDSWKGRLSSSPQREDTLHWYLFMTLSQRHR